MYINNITYTVYSAFHKANVECHASIVRRYRVTPKGAARIILKSSDAIDPTVSSIQYSQYSK